MLIELLFLFLGDIGRGGVGARNQNAQGSGRIVKIVEDPNGRTLTSDAYHDNQWGPPR